MGYRKNPVDAQELRRLAQARLNGHKTSATTALTLLEVQQLFEELEIHQIELELQNEHLNLARAQLELALSQSSELYDFAPVGIVSLDPAGTITKLNLAGASLLGEERARLLGRHLGFYVANAERSVFNDLLSNAQKTGDLQGGEVSISRNGTLAIFVQIWVVMLPEDEGWQVVLVDITQRKQVEEKLRLSAERWKLALEAAGDGVWDWNLLSGEMVFSRRFEELYGYSRHEYGNHLEHLMGRVYPDDKPPLMAAIQAYMNGKAASCTQEFRAKCKDGSWKWILCRGAIVSRDDEGKSVRMIGTHVDITSRKRIEEELRVSVRFQEALFDSLSAQIAVLDRHGTVLQTNAAWQKYAVENGFLDKTGFIGGNYLNILECLTGNDQNTVQAAAAGMASVASSEAASFQLPHPFFSPLDKRWFLMKVTPVHDVAERLVVSHEDVTKLKAAEMASMILANTDTLTGALGRRHFLNLAEQELTRSIRYELPLMVLMLDLDHFKLINDKYGHAAGDAVLQAFVQTVTSVLRESDFIGRLGGEEFAVLLPNTTPEGGSSLAHRIIENVRTLPVQVGQDQVNYTVSIGAGCLSGETTFAALLGLADAALYRAKKGGRNRLEIDPQSASGSRP